MQQFNHVFIEYLLLYYASSRCLDIRCDATLVENTAAAQALATMATIMMRGWCFIGKTCN